MKRFLILLLPVVAIFMLASCHDDNNLPDVDISFQFDNARAENGIVYVVQNDTLKLEGISVTAVSGSKEVGISAFPRFYFNGIPAPLLNIEYTAPYAFDMPMEYPVCAADEVYTLRVFANVFQVDKSIAFAECLIPIKVVASADDIPADAVDSYVKPGTKISDEAPSEK